MIKWCICNSLHGFYYSSHSLTPHSKDAMRKLSFLSPTQSLKWICLFILAFLVLELLLFNCFIFYALGVLQRTVGPLLNIGDVDWTEDLKQAPWVRRMVYRGKAGGFVSLMQDTVERLYMIEEEGSEKKLRTFGVDVSHSGEFLYIYRHILARRNFPYARLVIDIGANDGLLSSNSFNFIQIGWSGLLVEPQASQAEMAAKNVIRYKNICWCSLMCIILQLICNKNQIFGPDKMGCKMLWTQVHKHAYTPF